MTWLENASERPSFARITAMLSEGITTTHKHAYIRMCVLPRVNNGEESI